ncbi:AI-2E family transporter [Halomontanus rarus]|uniref:AI-2E family transporter n=1 Tax=Halomontanus rarus TaxID=3034020 RepID=UPI001A994EEC
MLGGYRFDRMRAPWWILGALIAGVLLYILYSFIGTFVFGLFLYYATRPVYQRLVGRLGSRMIAAAVSLITLAVPFMLLLAYTTAVAVQELSEALGEDGFGTLEAALEPYVDVSGLVSDPEQLLSTPGSTDIANVLLDAAPAYIGLFGTGALHALVMLALAYYLLKDDHLLARWFLRTFGDDEAVLESYCREIDRDFQNVFFGNILNAFITAIVGALVFSVLNVWAPVEVTVPYAVLVGVLCGAASLIPVVGMKLVYVPVAGYLFVRALVTAPAELVWFPLVFVVVAFVLVDFIPDMILRPYVSGRDLHLGAIMLAYILGPLLFGWYGIFLGPMLLIVTVHFVREVLPVLVVEKPIRPYGIDPAVARIPRDPSEEPGSGPDLEAAMATLEAESDGDGDSDGKKRREANEAKDGETENDGDRSGTDTN